MTTAEDRFRHLQDLTGIQALIGQTEDLHLDCKEWPSRDDDAQRVVAKAISGFANADGGCLVIGAEARSLKKDEPDAIQSLKPVQDALAVKSRIENLVGNLIEPTLPGIRVIHVLDVPGPPTGFVVVYVPSTDALPVRSRKHWNFFVRISAGTFPMEYFQLADMFGRRSRPVLSLWHQMGRTRMEHGAAYYEREFLIGIQNSGRAIARFPSLRFEVMPGINLAPYGLNGSGAWGLPQRPTAEGWVIFGGGADDVIYPGTHLTIAKMTHRSQMSGWVKVGTNTPTQIFKEVKFEVEIAADYVPYQLVSLALPADHTISY
jgi:hypothetical protein